MVSPRRAKSSRIPQTTTSREIRPYVQSHVGHFSALHSIVACFPCGDCSGPILCHCMVNAVRRSEGFRVADLEHDRHSSAPLICERCSPVLLSDTDPRLATPLVAKVYASKLPAQIGNARWNSHDALQARYCGPQTSLREAFQHFHHGKPRNCYFRALVSPACQQ